MGNYQGNIKNINNIIYGTGAYWEARTKLKME
jgi:hypothetical protein